MHVLRRGYFYYYLYCYYYLFLFIIVIIIIITLITIISIIINSIRRGQWVLIAINNNSY